MTILEQIKEYEDKGWIDPNCKTCIEYFYPQILAGKKMTDTHAPPHKPSEKCESGKRNHCSCDICF